MTDRFEALERLARLRELNVLTPEEFAAEKARILSADEPASSAGPMVEPADLPDDEAGRKKWLPWAIGGGVAAVAGAALAYSTMTELKDFPSKEADAGTPGVEQAELDQSGNADLQSLLQFEDPKKCELGEKLKTLTSRMAAQQEGSGAATVAVPDFEEPLKATLGRADAEEGEGGATIVAIRMPGEWNGLKVTGVRTVRWTGSEVLSLQIRFSETAEKVRRVLNAEGFTLHEVAELKDVGSGPSVLIGVENTSDGSALTCARMS